MGQIIQPGSSYSSTANWQSPRPFFFSQVLHEHGFKGFVAIVFAAIFAFAPLAALVWFNFFREIPVISRQCNFQVRVQSNQTKEDQDSKKPGNTGLLQVNCEVPASDGWRLLLRYDDPAAGNRDFSNSVEVRDEQVYLRKAGDPKLPFGLLGKPPLTAWVPAGDYEVAVVHETPHDYMQTTTPHIDFPFVTMIEPCTVQNRERTIVTVQLPHYGWGKGSPIDLAKSSEDQEQPDKSDLQPLLHSLEKTKAIPTLGGFVLLFGEPQVHHTEDHVVCTVDFHDLHKVPREWTRNQIAILRNWLPPDAKPARDKLSPLVTWLMRCEMFEGWFFYAMAGVSGLVFTKWGTIAFLQRWRRREMLSNTFTLCLVIFLISAAGWWLVAGNS